MTKRSSIAGWLANLVPPLSAARWASATPSQIPQVANGLGRIVAAALLPLLVVVGFLTCAGTASAQTKPDNVLASPLGPKAVQITFFACESSDYPDCDNPFSIYRNPPGFTKSAIVSNLPLGYGFYVGSSKTVWMDTTVKAGQTYTYEVCSGSQSASNCQTSNTVTVPVPSPPYPTVTLSASSPQLVQKKAGGEWDTTLSWTSQNATSLNLEPMNGSDTSLGAVPPSGSRSVDIPGSPTTYVITATNVVGAATAKVTVAIPTPCPSFAPPQSLSVYPYTSALKWTNPSTSPNTPYQACPSSPTDIVIYRFDGLAIEQIADLPANNGVLVTRYQDPGPLQPHSFYQYNVCEGPADTLKDNCAGTNVIVWGANPILTAAPGSSTDVKLEIAVDEAGEIVAITVTRATAVNSPGQKLGNGLMGCPTVGANGLPLSGPPPVTVYNWTSAPASTPNNTRYKTKSFGQWTMKSKSAPYIFDIPDDTTAKPGTTYVYWAQVQWGATSNQVDPLTQSSYGVTVSVPKINDLYAPQASLGGGIQPLKLSGGTPAPSQSGTMASVVTAPTASPMSRTITPAASSPMMAHPAGTTAVPLAAPQSATTARPGTAPMITPTTPMLPSARPMMSSSAGSTTASQSATTASVATASMVSQTSSVTPPAGPVTGSCPPLSGTAASPPMAPMMGSAPMLQPSHGMMSSTESVAARPLAQSAPVKLATAPMKTSSTASVRSVAPMPGAANVSAAIKEVQQKPHDAQALYALGKAYCASHLKDSGVSYMYMALLVAEQAGNASLTSQIKNSLAEQGVQAEELNRGVPR
jgi:hypothetical protein